MTTCVVVRKNSEIAIASDSLVTFGDTRLSHAYENNEKIFQVGTAYLALAGSAAHFPVMRKLFGGKSEEWRFGNREQVFETFSRAHEILKDKFFLNTKEEEDDPYESSQITSLVASPGGIFGVYSYREVFCFERFWSIGSGRNFALGAMYAVYDSDKTAAEIAAIGLAAGCEFDKNSAAPFRIYSLAYAPESVQQVSAAETVAQPVLDATVDTTVDTTVGTDTAPDTAPADIPPAV